MEKCYPKVAISILNWNDFHNTAETLASVRGLAYPNYEVWVVDNERRCGNQKAVVMKLRGYLDGLLGKPVSPDVKQYFEGKHSATPETAYREATG